jgi:hypothetical protein
MRSNGPRKWLCTKCKGLRRLQMCIDCGPSSVLVPTAEARKPKEAPSVVLSKK